VSKEYEFYEWIGPDRLVPRLGVMTRGKKFYLFDDMAKSLKKQGLIKPVDIKKKTKTKDKE